MAPLHDALRRELEKTVIKARDVAEAGARAALARLTVGDREPGAHLRADDRVLRNRLRAHARQLGDRRSERTGEQETDRLTQEVAYEAWHRMLFARFLAENRLLIHPEMQVPVSLEECEELAAEEGIGDGWLLASRYAARMLPEIFRPDDPVLKVSLSPEHQQELERLVGERTLPSETFLADDSLGWVYQFWQARRKEEVNASGEKITGETLPAVTQLFTESYMVSFLLENTIGAWWAGRNPGREPPIALPYLRRVANGTPAAGTFEGWPKTWGEFTLLDPCCGSGHFLVSGLKLIVALRMHDEGLSARDAVDAVLRENLHGLELDARCTQIAAFALALSAWAYPNSGGYRPLPDLHVACSGLAVSGRREEWIALAQSDSRLMAALDQLYRLFRRAPELGSLLDPTRGTKADLWTASFEEVRPIFERALNSDRIKQDAALEATAVAAHGVWKAAELLGRKYTLVATNVPYLGRAKQSETLRAHAEEAFEEAKDDLATMFVVRSLDACAEGGSLGLVTPQGWLFQKRYARLRGRLLDQNLWNVVARLGSQAFDAIGGAVVNVVLLVVSNRAARADATIAAIDATEGTDASLKSELLRVNSITAIQQASQRGNPDSIVSLSDVRELRLLGDAAFVRGGITTGDSPRFRRCHWEIRASASQWARQQGTVEDVLPYGGREYLLLWENGEGTLVRNARGGGATIAGREAWGHRGVAVTYTGSLNVTLYGGELFENVICVVVPRQAADLPAVWAFCSSSEFHDTVRSINPKLSVDVRYFEKVPFDLTHWTQVAEELYPSGLPEPHSDDPAQWLFDGQIATSTAPLQVAVARLLGYRWSDQPKDRLLDGLADQDGIVCLVPARGERSGADRLNQLLSVAYGSGWSPSTQEKLLAGVGMAAKSIETWLREAFFEQHLRFFHQRPFIWHIWDGRKDGFGALVNYLMLDRRTLESLTYTYLGDWIARQEEARQRNETGAETRLVAAKDLQDKLKSILAGEPPYDLFVRWKSLHEQPVGWEPDLNDGVRVNIWPFVKAGILRKLPNIKWGKDRGKNPPSAPWGEERWNRYEDIPREQRPEYLRDVDHLTTQIKRRAREAHARGLPLSRLNEVDA